VTVAAIAFESLQPTPKFLEAVEREAFSRVHYLHSSWWGFPKSVEIRKMDRRDQELLDKQLRNIPIAQKNDSVMILALLIVFFSGMALGGFFYAFAHEPMQVASAQLAGQQQVASNEVPIFAPQGSARQ
jgi:hypothetical protein